MAKQPVPAGINGHITLYDWQKTCLIDADLMGKMLYPAAKDPQRATLRIYNRNKDRFTDRDSILFKAENTYKRAEIRGQIDHGSRSFTRQQEMRFFSIPYGVQKVCVPP